MADTHDEIVSLRQYVDLKVEHERELRDEWRRMNEIMVRAAKEYVDGKLEKMNEMRDQITDERGQFQNRGEHIGDMKALDARIKIIENLMANYQGRMMIVGAIFGTVVILIGHFWK